MTPPRPLLVLPALLCLFPVLSTARAAGWPENGKLERSTTSPDGRCAVLAPAPPRGYVEPGAEAGREPSPPAGQPNFLADLKDHQILIQLDGISRYHGDSSLWADWADDSSWCVVNEERRWGFRHLLLLEKSPAGPWVQTDLGKMIHSVSDPVGKVDLDAWLGADSAGTVLHVYAVSNTPVEGNAFVAFSGRYDMAAKKWLSSKAARISAEDGGIASYARHSEVKENAAAWHQRMDARMNQVYARLKAHEGAADFAGLQERQRDWLTHDKQAAEADHGDLSAANLRLAIRLHQVRDLLVTVLVDEGG